MKGSVLYTSLQRFVQEGEGGIEWRVRLCAKDENSAQAQRELVFRRLDHIAVVDLVVLAFVRMRKATYSLTVSV